MTIEKLLKDTSAEIQKLNEQQSLLAALPPGLPLKLLFKMHDTWHLVLEEGVPAAQPLLDLLPPAPVTIVLDGWGQPTFEEIASPEPRVFPMWTTHKAHEWFSKVEDFRIRVSLPSSTLFEPPHEFHAVTFAHNTVYLRRRRKMSVVPTAATLAAEEGLNEDDARRAVLALAASVVNEYLAKYAQTQKNSPRAEVLSYVAQRATGAAIAFSSRDFGPTGPTRDLIRHNFWIQFRGFHESFSFDIPAVYDKNGIDWLLPPGIEYEGL